MFPSLDMQIEFLLSTWVRSVLLTLATSISVTIHDLECGNAQIRNSHKPGRPQNVATLASRGVIWAAQNGFYRVHGKFPDDAYGDAMIHLQSKIQAALGMLSGQGLVEPGDLAEGTC